MLKDLKIKRQNTKIQGQIFKRPSGFICGAVTAMDGVATSVPDVRLPCSVLHAFQLWFLNTAASTEKGAPAAPGCKVAFASGHVCELTPETMNTEPRTQRHCFLTHKERMIRTAFSLSNPSPSLSNPSPAR